MTANRPKKSKKVRSEREEKILAVRREHASGCVVSLRHVPYGFMEKEMFQYFSQFGQVKRIRLPRSKNGTFKERAYVYFADKEVAKVAAETMNNYLMFGKRIRCSILEDKIPPTILTGPRLIVGQPLRNRALIEAAKKAWKPKTDEEEEQRKKSMVSSLRKTMRKVRSAGIDYEFDYAQKL
ncbi:Sterile alpha motif-like proteiny 2 and RNA recognition motif domain containing protein [Aphelenchoides besseyi]|nr:Sterile alpha motif-like proteiny 2 and RNA recognition motif domain containing protein [Aphelenchoides besseyi]